LLKLKHMLDFDNIKTEIFQSFRIVGNVLALCFLLDTVLVQRDTSNFVLSAPFVGVTPDNVHGTVGDFKKKSTILNTFNSFLPQVDPANGYATQDVLDSLPLLAQRNHDLCTPKKANLVLNVLQKIDAILDRTNAKSRWLGEAPPNGVLDVDPNEEFYKVWSVMQFLFCLPEADSMNDEDTFGHGFAWAGCSIIHMLQQRHRFEMFDFSYYTLAAMELDASVLKTAEELAPKKGAKNAHNEITAAADELKSEATSFVYYAKSTKTVNDIIYSTLAAVLPQQPKPVVLFKGPDDDEDLARASQSSSSRR